MADSPGAGTATPPPHEALATRLAAQLLARDVSRSPVDVASRVLAIQAQDPRGFRLSVRSRSTGLTAADVDHALTVDRTLVVTWLHRGTLHLVATADYWWLHPLTTPQLAVGNRRRLRQEGVNAGQAERGVEVVAEAVASDGPQTRTQLRRLLDGAGVPTAGQALVHLLMAASLQGLVVRGPMVGDDHAHVSVPAWLGPAPPDIDRPEALRRLARRYLAGHGPASPHDLAKWAGVTLGDARRGFEGIADEVRPVGRDGLVGLAAQVATGAMPPPVLLGPFDPILHGWASREPVVGRHAGVVTSNGIFRPVALVDGRVVATWSLPGGVVTIHPLEPVPGHVRDALVSDAADVRRYLALPDRPAAIA